MADTAAEVAMAGGKRRGAWMAHVKKTMRSHKGMPLSKVLRVAAKTYKHKGNRGTRRGGGLSPLPISGGRRRRHTRKH